MNFDEAVHGAGGVIVGDDGKPNVATPEATKGLSTLVDWFKTGYIPKAAITWTEEEGRQAFQHGELIFHRNWGYVTAAHAKNDKASKIKGKFEAAPLPGITGPGVSSLGGHSFAIAKNAENKGTALDFLKYAASPEIQKEQVLKATLTPVTRGDLHGSGRAEDVPVLSPSSSSRCRARSRVRRPWSTVMSPWPSRMPRTAHSKVRPLLMLLCRLCRASWKR